MKKLKQLGALVLALMLAVALCCPAVAAGSSCSITIKNAESGHTYEAYQIFAGDLDNSGKTLSNVTWGNGVKDQDTLLNFNNQNFQDVTALAAYLNDSNLNDFATYVAGHLATVAGKSVQSKDRDENVIYEIKNLAPGYYLVKDENDSLKNTEGTAYTRYIVQVLGNVETNAKSVKPTLDKEIKHNETDTWGVVGDNQIGDTVEFRTITTVPDTAGYTNYDYIIHDTMSAGLTSNVVNNNENNKLIIKVNDSNNNGTVLDANYYTVEIDNSNSNKFAVTVKIMDAIRDGVLKANDKLYTYYSGILNKDAIIYDKGKQDNIAYLEYSNNPNNTSDKGETPKKKVYDWTFKMGINKIDGTRKQKLEGATFVLSRTGTLKVSDMNCNENGVPATTNALIALIDNGDNTYTVAPANYDGVTTYVITAGDVTIKGLDDATDYYLYETKAPNGYNLLKDAVKFKITAQYSEDGASLVEGQPTVTVGNGTSSATLSTDIVNNAGSTLPTTGGMGTTVLYVVGGALVVCAGVALVAKKRMQ